MSRQISTLYCDDIRHELGKKASYIGCYSGTLYVPQFPTTLSKLCIFLKATTPSTDPFGKLKVRIALNDRVIGEQDVETDNEEDSEPDGKKRLQVVRIHFVFSPFRIKQEGIIRLTLTDERGEEYRDANLRIEVAEPGKFSELM
ncbi:hypothetical protein ACEP1S_17610 [Pseudomonas aeruginosa]|uniref:DUF6941 family protein n=1 Tax=Pseudomonas aeruginosa TaxID=287 RepID=UPI00117AF192|nr:hypothetical protein [Pseudomonas aeruginosa]KAA2293298.1 hypothetical protein F1C11_34595 [Pseudomonas aeruginosa]MDG4275967.1 hypothetical protein [Pseudomonas aeruginosa]HCL3802833.1 hypothetical protein [Pseudomonas aeruginosa]HCR1245150.1 hypothetical protein [Pseudomonas aeruginosa]HCR1432741.1 hypothetical protein [Pseudomonas aeruginosa]